ncbi:MAG: LysM peptidoglycan-binding domain-containing protein [Thermodesulfobacteriaceae bacterium]
MKNICKIIYIFLSILLFLSLFFFEQASSVLAATKTNKSTSKNTTKKTDKQTAKPKTSKNTARPSPKSFTQSSSALNFPSTDGEITYQVKKGDTLFRIAKQFGLSIEELMAMNGLTSPTLKVGQVLVIRRQKTDSIKDVSPSEAPALGGQQAQFLEHKVSKGETLFSLAKKYGLSVGEILEANGLTDLTIREGMVLKVPVKAKVLEQPKETEKPKDIEKTTKKPQTPSKGQEIEAEPNRPQSEANDERAKKRLAERKVYHVVKKGETLASLARKYHTTPEEIKRLNNLRTTRLKPGQKLLVKVEKGEEIRLSISLTSDMFNSPSSKPYLVHRVKEGETLYRISLMYGVSVEEIKLLNGLNDNIILVGQELKIPFQDFEKPRLREPIAMFKAEEEPLTKKFGRFTLSKVEVQALREKFLELSRQYANVKYRFGGEGNGALDCSAFVQRVYSELGIKLPRSSYHQYLVGQEVDKSELIPGDLVFFKTSKRAPVTHVGIYIGDNKFVHVSSKRRGFAIDSLDDPYFRARFVGAKRVLNGEVLQYFQEYRRQRQEKESASRPQNTFDVLH